MKPEIKKLLILNLPYLLFVWLFDKVGAAVRLSPGADASAKLLHLGDGFTTAFSSIAPSFHPADLLIGIAGAVIVRLIIYTKGKNAKKYRRGTEYGSARMVSYSGIFWFSMLNAPLLFDSPIIAQRRGFCYPYPRSVSFSRSGCLSACKMLSMFCLIISYSRTFFFNFP